MWKVNLKDLFDCFVSERKFSASQSYVSYTMDYISKSFMKYKNPMPNKTFISNVFQFETKNS